MRRLFGWLLDDALADSVIGDLREQYSARAARSRWRALAWISVTTLAILGYLLGRCAVQAAASSVRLLADFGADIGHASRRLRREPGPTLVAVLALSLSIGLCTTVFAQLNGMYLRPYLGSDPAVFLPWRTHETGASLHWQYREVAELRRLVRSMTLEIALAQNRSVTVGDSGGMGIDAGELPVAFVTGSYLAEFGASASTGRLLRSEDDEPGGSTAAVLDYRFWRTQLGGDPTVVGRLVHIAGVPARIVGVANRDFIDPNRASPSLWLPLSARDLMPALPDSSPDPHQFVAVVRLGEGTGVDAAEAEIARLTSNFVTERGASTPQATGADFMPTLSPERRATMRLTIGGVLAVLAFLLLLATANVANVLLANAESREREFAVRRVLGASRARLVRLLVTESLAIAILAGVAGLLCAAWSAPMLGVLLGWPGADVAPDARVYTFLTAATVACGLGAGLAPARAAYRQSAFGRLKGRRIAGTGRITASPLRSGLVAVQATASVVLVTLAALLARALVDVAWQDPGYQPERLVNLHASTPGVTRQGVDEAKARTYWLSALERIRSLPDVEAAAIASYPPFAVSFGQPDDDPFVNETDAGYFDAIGSRLVRGRLYTAAEVRDNAGVAVIDQRVARRFWGEADPLGADLGRVQERLSRYRVVGIVADAMVFGLDNRRRPLIYVPHTTFRRAAVVVRTSDPVQLSAAIAQAVEDLAPEARPRTLVVGERFDRDFRAPRRLAGLAAGIAALALGVAAVGLYGVTASAVGRRRREIGVRMAIGAQVGSVVRLIVRETMRPVVLGLVLGVGTSLAGSRLLTSLLYDVSPRDPVAIVAAVITLLVVSGLACSLPARRASRVDPVAALRAE